MTQEYLTKLAQIYNTLLTVGTKGQDTIIMGQCLSAFQQLIMLASSDVNAPIEDTEEVVG